MTQTYRTLRAAPSDEGVLSVVIDAPPMNLIGPELVRDFVTLVSELNSDEGIRVMVLESADPEYFVPHVDLTKVAEYTAEAGKAGGPADASLGMLWHKLSELPVVAIAKIRGRARGAGSELVLACDMRFAARENARTGSARDRFRCGAGCRRRAAPGPATGTRSSDGGDSGRRRPERGRGRAVRLDQPSPTRRRTGRVRGATRATHRVVPCRCGAIYQAGAQRTDLARARTRSAPTPGGSSNLSARTPSRLARQLCSRRGCRLGARSNSISAIASDRCDGRKAMAGGGSQRGQQPAVDREFRAGDISRSIAG